MYRDSCALDNPNCCGKRNRSVTYFEIGDICELCIERIEYEEMVRNKEYMKHYVFRQLKQVMAHLVEEEEETEDDTQQQEDEEMSLCE